MIRICWSVSWISFVYNIIHLSAHKVELGRDKVSEWPVTKAFANDIHVHVLRVVQLMGFSFNPFQNKPIFLHVRSTNLLKTLRIGEIAHNEQFLLFTKCFLPFQRAYYHFYRIWDCHLQILLFWKSLKFVLWERVNVIEKLKIVWKRENIAYKHSLFFLLFPSFISLDQ